MTVLEVKLLNCPHCDVLFNDERRLRGHLSNKHSLNSKDIVSILSDLPFAGVCRSCSMYFRTRMDFDEHQYARHQGGFSRKMFSCHKTTCDFETDLMSKFLEHVREQHTDCLLSGEFEEVQRYFFSKTEFLAWKDKMELDSCFSYSVTSSNALTVTYGCALSKGRIRSDDKKVSGRSKKLQHHCPAVMKVCYDESGLVDVCTFLGHVGHVEDPSKQRINPFMKTMITESLSNTRSAVDVVQVIRRNFGASANRLSLIDSQDVRNVKQSPGVCPERLSNNDYESVKIRFASELKLPISERSSGVRFYREAVSEDGTGFINGFAASYDFSPPWKWCRWHVYQSWLRNMNKIKKASIRSSTFSSLCVLSTFDTEVKFRHRLQQILSFLTANGEDVFAAYFVKYYCESGRFHRWTFFDATILHTTNMYCESFHRILKVEYLKKSASKRLDFLIEILAQCLNDTEWRCYAMDARGKCSYLQGKMHDMHRKAMEIYGDMQERVEECVEHGVRAFQVRSSSDSSRKYIVWPTRSCTCEKSELIHCRYCDLCPFTLSCTCSFKGEPALECPHVHLVHSVKGSVGFGVTEAKATTSASSESLSSTPAPSAEIREELPPADAMTRKEAPPAADLKVVLEQIYEKACKLPPESNLLDELRRLNNNLSEVADSAPSTLRPRREVVASRGKLRQNPQRALLKKTKTRARQGVKRPFAQQVGDDVAIEVCAICFHTDPNYTESIEEGDAECNDTLWSSCPSCQSWAHWACITTDTKCACGNRY